MHFFNGPIFLSQTITFLIALAIVWIAAWKPLLKFMQERQQKIDSDLKTAEQTRVAITRLEEDYKQRLQQVEQKSGELLALAKLEGEKVREQIVKKAQEEIVELRQKAQEQLGYEREQLMRELRAEIVTLSMSVARRVLTEQVFSGMQKSRFEGILAELESGKEPQRAK